MGHFEYKPGFYRFKDKTNGNVKIPSIGEYFKTFGEDYKYFDETAFKSCILNFFKHPEIQGLLDDENWDQIFLNWLNDYQHKKFGGGTFYGNEPGWHLDVLADFLYLIGVNFWDYFTDNLDERVKKLLDDNLVWIP